MSEKLCTLRTKGGGGGRYTETSLWTNSAPTSNFADQNVTLSDSITNYKYIAIRIRFSTTESASATTIVSTSDFVTMTNTTTSGHPLCFVGGRYSNVYERAVYYVDATTVKFGSSFQQNSTSVSNGTIVPTEILGLNELKPGTDVGLVTNGASFSAKTSVTINCKVGDYIALGYGRSASGYSVYWNGTVLGQSSDFVTGYSLSTNNFVSIMKASQTSNTFSVASGATLTGGYQIFSLG